jgi:hypothetical protein
MADFNIFNADEFHLNGIVLDNTIFKTATDFSQFVETTAAKQGLTLTQVILDYCENKDVDYLDVAKLLSQTLKDKIAFEMQEAGLLPKHTVLEFE